MTDRPEGIERRGDVDAVKYWQMQIALAKENRRDFEKRGEAVVERYRDEREINDSETRFNILWSNTETLKAALYAKSAVPDVRRRYPDKNPVARQVAVVLERVIAYCNDIYDSDAPIEAALEDHLLPGIGQCRVRYKADIGTRMEAVQSIDPLTFEPVVTQVPTEYVADQNTRTEHVHWKDFLYSPAKKWEDVRWVAYRHLMTRKQMEKQEFNGAGEVPLNWTPKDDKDIPDSLKRSEVWEIWDKDKRKVCYVHEGYNQVLKEEDDPLGLEGFFDCPCPLFSVTTNDNLIPIPEFTIYQYQADELDRVSVRITKLVEALKRRGVYASQLAEQISNIGDLRDNEFAPIENWQALMEKGGLAGVMQSEDLAPIVAALQGLYQQRAQIIQTIYEVTGISDVIRGSSDPNETATAQRLKGQFGSMRLQKRQAQVQRFIKEIYRIKGEIIAEHYDPEVLGRISGQQISPQMVQIMRDDKMRGYAVDIETDSTVFTDEQAEKAQRIEFITATTNFLKEMGPVVMQAPQLAPMMGEMLMFGARSFKVGRALEESMEQAVEAMKQRASQPPPPDPKVELEKAKLQNDAAKTEIERGRLEIEKVKTQADIGTMQADDERATEDMILADDRDRQRIAIEAEKVDGLRTAQSANG